MKHPYREEAHAMAMPELWVILFIVVASVAFALWSSNDPV